MRILYIVPYIPSLIRVRPYNLIRHLAKRGHQLTVMTVWTNESERDELLQIKPYCDHIHAKNLSRGQSLINCLLTLPTSIPLQASYCWELSLAKRIIDLVDHNNSQPSFDIVHVEHLRGVRYGLYIKSTCTQIPVVWDSVDCISLLFRQAIHSSKKFSSRFMTNFELSRTKRYEGWLLGQFDRTLVTSNTDKDEFISLLEDKNNSPSISVIPNGVDLDYFKPDENIKRDPATLVISGKMSYHANISMVLNFVETIMPLVLERRPDAKLVIVGKDPPKVLKNLVQNPSISVTGTVINIRPYLQQTTISIAPLTYGAGIQNKVLEAMACATPVVASPQAISALSVQLGQDLLVAKEPDDFAKAILQLLENPSLQQQVGNAGRMYVEKNHQWSSVAAQLEGVYNEVINTKH